MYFASYDILVQYFLGQKAFLPIRCERVSFSGDEGKPHRGSRKSLLRTLAGEKIDVYQCCLWVFTSD